jgi:hypothetical protein
MTCPAPAGPAGGGGGARRPSRSPTGRSLEAALDEDRASRRMRPGGDVTGVGSAPVPRRLDAGPRLGLALADLAEPSPTRLATELVLVLGTIAIVLATLALVLRSVPESWRGRYPCEGRSTLGTDGLRPSMLALRPPTCVYADKLFPSLLVGPARALLLDTSAGGAAVPALDVGPLDAPRDGATRGSPARSRSTRAAHAAPACA